MKRYLSLLLAMAMIVTMLPQTTVFASEEQTQTPTVLEESVPQETVPVEPVTDSAEKGADLPTDFNEVYDYATMMDFSTDDAEGRVTLMCPVCQVEAEWLPLVVNQSGKSSSSVVSGHYYLSSSIDYTQNNGRYNLAEKQVCINLNGQNLTSSTCAFYNSGNSAILNIMGDGTVSGAGTQTSPVRGVLDLTANTNLFGGTYISTNKSAPAAEMRKSSSGTAYLNVFAGTKLLNSEGGEAVGITVRGNMNIYGGTMGVVFHRGNGALNIAGNPDIEKVVLADNAKFEAGGACGETLEYTLSAEGVLTICGGGEMENYSEGGSPWHAFAEYIQSVVIEGNVSYIGDNAFYGCSNLSSAVYKGTAQQWNDVSISEMGNECLLNLDISTESPVTAVEIQPLTMTVENGGAQYPEGYYQYYWWMDMMFRITMWDGSVIEGTGTSFDYNGEVINIDTFDDQDVNNPWLAGNTYYGSVDVMGYVVSVPVTIEESFIDYIVFDTLDIRENTLGGEYWENPGAQPYYRYYWWNQLQFTVYTRSGETVSGSGSGFWYNDVWYNFTTSDDQSYEHPWTVGNAYSGKVSVAGYETWVSVYISQNPIVAIEFAPISIMANTNGFWNTVSPSGNTYYYYQWWNQLTYTVTFSDGCVNTYNGLSFEHHGELLELGSGDNQDYYSAWTAGNTYNVTILLGNVDYNVPVTIKESEVASIEAKPLSISAGSCGSLIRSESGSDGYFRYEWWKYVSYTVTFRDGTTIGVTGDTFEHNGITYTLEHNDDQHAGNVWTAGSGYTGSIYVPGCSAEVLISISAPQADKIDLPELVLNGYNEANIQTRGQIAAFKFIPEESGYYTFASQIGMDTYGYLFDYGYQLIARDDDGGDGNNFMLGAQLTAGQVYILGARYYSYEFTGTFPVVVSKSVGIERVEFQPISISVNTCGSYESQEPGMDAYYRYYWWNRLNYVVYFEDGASISTGGTGFWYGDNYYELVCSDNQSALEPWTEGNTYNAQVSLSGVQYAVNVTIESSNIASVSFSPIVLAEEGYGNYTTRWNESTQQDEEFFQYYWWNNINYQITFKDGTSTSGTGSGYYYNDQYCSFETEDNQYANPWKTGGVYYPVVNVGGQRYEIQVSVQPVNVQSITVAPIVMMEHTNGCWQNSYSGQYYEYYWWNNLQYTIVFENGQTLSGTGTSVYYNGQWNYFRYNDSQNYENQFVLGGSYSRTLKLFGYETSVQVSITDTLGGRAGENVAWTLDSQGNFTLSGNGALYHYSGSNDMEWECYKDAIRTVTVGEGVTDLQRFAFYGCYNLETVTFSSTVENVGDYTFAYCSSLRDVTFSDGVTMIGANAFRDCVGLETITLGSNVAEVREFAFSSCTNLREVTLPATLKVLGDWAFYPCSDLQTVYFMGTEMAWSNVEHRGHTGLQHSIEVQCLGVAEILAEGICGDLTWKVDSDNVLTFEGTGVIPDYTAEELPEWKAYEEQICLVKLSEGITEIGNYAFYEFPVLQGVDMDTMVTRVGDYAFYNCDSLDSFVLREIDVIGSYAFAECDRFFYTCFGSDWTSIGDYAFYHNGVAEVEYSGPGYQFYQENIGIGNDDLLNAHLYSIEEAGVVLSGRCGEGVYWIHYETGELKIFGEGAIFNYDHQEKPWERFGYPVFAINIEEGITSIGNYAFSHSGNVKTLTIPGTVKYIGNGAFWDLANVNEVIIPEGVEEIAANAFNYSGMEKLSLPDSLKVIGSEAFRQCDNLTEIIIPKGVEVIDQNAFMACHALTAIRVDEENAFYSSDDRGVLYNKDQTVLVCAPSFISGTFTVPETVQRIETYAFAHCTNLDEVIMGDNVTEIGFFAFKGCYALSSVTFGSGITELNNGIFMESGLGEFVIPEGITAIKPYAFQGCEHLTKVVIPETVAEIGEYAFAYCMSLTAADIPASVTYVGEYAFYQCDMLSQVNLPAGITEIREFAFADCTELTSISIPDSVETIGAYAFIGCTNLTDLTIGKNVTAIGDSAFEGCVALTEVSVPQGVTEFVYRMFAGCTSLEKVEIPDSVQSIGDMTFADCNTLTEITVPDSVETIGDYAFKQCENLSVVNIGKGVYQIGYNPFYDCGQLTAIRVHADNNYYSSDSYGALYEDEVFLLRVPAMLSGEFVIRDGTVGFDMETFWGCTELTSVVVPGSVRVIPEAAFSECYNLKTVTINEGVEELGSMAFAFCSALEEIVIPSTVIWIGSEAFVDCHALKSVTLPEGITDIFPYTFAWCYSLETVTIPKSVRLIYNSAFAGCNELKEVIYGGRMSDWMQIGIWEDNYALYSAVITYSGDDEVLDSGSCGENVYWSLSAGGKLIVFGDGAMDNYGLYDGTAPWASYASDIRSVEIQEGVTFVGNNAFGYCENVISVTVAGTVTELGSQCFFGCGNLRNVTLNDGLVTIGRNAFAECSCLAELEIPNTVEFIGETAFVYTALRSLYIPASVTTIEGDIFYNCDKLETIFVDGANAYYTSDERGVLYNKEKTELLRAPCALNGTYIVPEGVETIAAYAFFPCRNLNVIHLPESLKAVAGYAFYCCDNLWDVHYAGSESDWEQVSVDSENNALLNANIYFGRESNLGEGVCGDNLTWVLDTNGRLVISGAGAMYDYEGQGPWWQLNDRIETVFVEDGVTSIGSYAFRGCYSLYYVQLADTVETIGYYAFFDCDGLTEFSIPSALTTIGESAFYDCDSLHTVYSNSRLSAVYACAFKGCNNLTTFWFAEGLTTLGEEAFMNTGLTSVILPKTMQRVGDRVFAGSKIREASVEDSELTALGNGFFENCTELQSANLGNNIVVMGIDVFNGCTALSSVHLSGSFASMGERCFKNCRSLQSISIPDGVTQIHSETFYACENLNLIYLGANVESIGDYAFYGAGIQELTASSSLRTIGTGAFSNCQRMTQLSGIDNVTEIGSNAFEDCYSLYSFTIPAGVTYISHYTFANCYALRTLYMCNLVSGIGYNAFAGCYNLVDVNFDGSKTQFEAIYNEGGNEILYNANLNCTQAPENVYYCEHCGQEVEWQDWNGVAESGHFRLTEDYYGNQVMVGSATTPGVTMVIDLRGYTLYSTKRVFTVYSGNELYVLDTVGGGVLSGGETNTIGGAVLVSGGNFYLRGGTVTSQTNNSGGCVYVTNYGYFQMNGGQLIGAALSNGRRGGALYVDKNTTAALNSGLITDGIGRGASIYVANDATVSMSYVTVGEVLAANDAYINLYNMPVVDALDMTSGARLYMDYLEDGARITVYADDVFTYQSEYADNNAKYFTPGFEHSVIVVEDNALKVSYPDEVEVVDVTILEMPYKWQYEQGEKLDLTGLQLLAYYSDGYEEVVEDGYIILASDDTHDPGVKTVYVGYEGYTTYFNVIVNEKRVTNVQLHAQPNKLQYYVGEELDLSGLELQVFYSNGDEEFISDGYTFTATGDLTVLGVHTVVVSYAGLNVAFDITVKHKEIVILKQPESVKILEGEAVQFTVEAENVVSWQWQYKHAGATVWEDAVNEGFNTAALVMLANLVSSGYSFRCALTDAVGNITYTDEVVLEVIPLVITVTGIRLEKLPEKLTYNAGEALDLSGLEIIASYSYGEDQIITDGYTVEGFDSNVGGKQTITVLYEGATAQFFVTVIAKTAAITLQPVDVTADAGDSVNFSVATEGDVVSYRWQYKRADGDAWYGTSMTGYNTDTLVVTASAGRHNNSYRCVVTFADGTELISESAVLTVITQIVVTKQPNDQVVVLGYKAQFTVVASGAELKYQWQYKRQDSDQWFDTNMDGATKSTVLVETTKNRDGYQYRCKLTDKVGTVAYSEPATMTVLTFVEQPVDVYTSVSSSVQFTVKASTDRGITYQWQYRRSSTASWSNTTMTGYNTNTLTVSATKNRNGYQYRCVLTGDKNSKLESNAVTLYVSEPVEITSQPQSVTVAAGESAVFTVEATNVKSYQWKYSKNGTTWYNTSATGNKTATLTVTSPKNGYMYRCHITGMDGIVYITNEVVLTVK